MRSGACGSKIATSPGAPAASLPEPTRRMRLGWAHQLARTGARQAAHVQPDTGRARELYQRGERDRLRERRNGGKPEAGGHLAVVRDAALGKPQVLGAQPYRKAEGRRVLKR